MSLQPRRSPRGSVDWNQMSRSKTVSSTVAPLVGAWIEIFPRLLIQSQSSCRSPRGSVDWNLNQEKGSDRLKSLPSWERGLKYKSTCNSLMHRHVAPLVGAWIEIIICFISHSSLWSLPSWERGLKSPYYRWILTCFCRSPRGSVDWNSIADIQIIRMNVAPLVGAWIEILPSAVTSLSSFVAPLVGAWIEI